MPKLSLLFFFLLLLFFAFILIVLFFIVSIFTVVENLYGGIYPHFRKEFNSKNWNCNVSVYFQSALLANRAHGQ